MRITPVSTVCMYERGRYPHHFYMNGFVIRITTHKTHLFQWCMYTYEWGRYIVSASHTYKRGRFVHHIHTNGVYVLQHTATHCKISNTLPHTATHCNTLQHTSTHCNTLQHTATHCNTLQHTATHCNTLQHNTLQHTATHCSTCNALQYSRFHIIHIQMGSYPHHTTRVSFSTP